MQWNTFRHDMKLLFPEFTQSATANQCASSQKRVSGLTPQHCHKCRNILKSALNFKNAFQLQRSSDFNYQSCVRSCITVTLGSRVRIPFWAWMYVQFSVILSARRRTG